MQPKAPNAIDTAQEFATWKRDDKVDNTIYCNCCNHWFDYRIYLVHDCQMKSDGQR
jgi:hypothetical protein